ncbi:MAG: two-component system response regulator [Deltaproteobacteria bacterium]|nr:response regulator [Deltaproteobacteria bacterium]RLA89387.1 MAG: two-component system response regulator [Deltaproteobacteria bacterium]
MSYKILVVDDDKELRESLAENLEIKGYSVLTAKTGLEGKELFLKEKPDIVFTDVMMPDGNGFYLLKEIHSVSKDAEVIMITSYGDMDMAIEAIRVGAGDFIPKPVKMNVVDVALKRAIERLSLKQAIKSYTHNLEQMIQDRSVELTEQIKKSNTFLKGIISALNIIIEKFDPFNTGHSKRVAIITKAISVKMGYPPSKVQTHQIAAALHDIGKIFIPTNILSKPSALTKDERLILQRHPIIGYEIVKEVGFPSIVPKMILQHHERLDGSGYPKKLKGNQIAMESRILAVADVIEAISSKRSYRPALGLTKAIEEIKKGRNIKYDKDVVDVCIELIAKKRKDFLEGTIIF